MPRGRCIIVLCLLELCSILGLEVRVWLVLRFLWMGMVEAFDGLTDIVEHGDVHFAVGIIPVEVHAEVPTAFPFM